MTKKKERRGEKKTKTKKSTEKAWYVLSLFFVFLAKSSLIVLNLWGWIKEVCKTPFAHRAQVGVW